MKMFLLRTKSTMCKHCSMGAIVMIRAEDETAARQAATRSNSHGTDVTGIKWADEKVATCHEFPVLDGPSGIVVGSWLDLVLPS